jgi:protein involved in polysaccharide export with SLBB domain
MNVGDKVKIHWPGHRELDGRTAEVTKISPNRKVVHVRYKEYPHGKEGKIEYGNLALLRNQVLPL